MTTNTPNQTLKFPFGETPEEVIRERLAATREKTLRIEADRKIDVWMFTSSDHLLTVLDALYRDAVAATRQPAGVDLSFPGIELATPPQTTQGQLRTSILAALGVTEQ